MLTCHNVIIIISLLLQWFFLEKVFLFLSLGMKSSSFYFYKSRRFTVCESETDTNSVRFILFKREIHPEIRNSVIYPNSYLFIIHRKTDWLFTLQIPSFLKSLYLFFVVVRIRLRFKFKSCLLTKFEQLGQ